MDERIWIFEKSLLGFKIIRFKYILFELITSDQINSFLEIAMDEVVKVDYDLEFFFETFKLYKVFEC